MTITVPDGALYIPIRSEDPRLKRHILHDPRSRNYELDVTGLTLVDVEWSSHLPVLDQGQAGKCTAEDAANLLGSDPLFASLPVSVQQDLQLHADSWTDAFYNDEENLDGDGPYPPQDNGSTGLTSAKVARSRGLISGYQHTFSTDAALKALQKLPGGWGTLWKTGMDDVNETTGQVRYTGTTRGGHEICVYRVDVAKQQVWFHQSWGAWGYQRRGIAWISFDDFDASLRDQGDMTYYVPLSQPAPTPTPPAPAGPVTKTFTGDNAAFLDTWAAARHYGANKTAATIWRTTPAQ